MPKAINYKENSVIYFSGDSDNRVFLLNKGHISLTSIDIETGEKITEYLKTGEFFGVKSALGNYPREESAMVLSEATVYSFSVQEFEDFAQKNTRIVMQMIKIFSHQLRTIHRKLESLLHSEEEKNVEDGLFTVISTFYNSQHFKAAGEVALRYKKLYPNGKHTTEVNQIMQQAGEIAGKSFGFISGSGLANNNASKEPMGQMPAAATQGISDSNESMSTVTFKLGEDLFEKGQWAEAYNQYRSIIEAKPSPLTEVAYIRAGSCLYNQKEYVRCLQILTNFITQYPKSLKLAEALMYIGLCYQGMDRPDKARQFYDKAALMAGPLLVPKIKELQANCEGA